jgi:hypothetical protein
VSGKINDGGPAFPGAYGSGMFAVEGGMSMRDAAALAALASWPVTDRNETAEGLARKCWALADAFIAARDGKL